MRPTALPRPFLVLIAAYFLASLGHFAHNAEFICEYPNLPAWLTSAQVYATWSAITAVGTAGLLMLRGSFPLLGLALVAAYAALGFDGLGHYAVAPIGLHSFGANATIISEAVVAALLLSATLYAMATRLRHRLVD